MMIEPKSARYTLEPLPMGLRASIPAGRNWFVLLFLAAWLVGWAFGEVSAVNQLISPHGRAPSLFLAAWLTGWTMGGFFCLCSVLWQLAGREILLVDGVSLMHRIEIFGLGWSWTYRSSDVRNLRAVVHSADPFASQRALFPPLGGSGHGLIAFDYGARTIRLAPALEEAEATMLVGELLRRLPERLA